MSDAEITVPDQRQAPLSLWRAARAFVCTLFDLFGAPEQLAARHTLTFTQHKLILPWLRAGEALMRRLLLIEAALMASEKNADQTPPPARGRLGGGQRQRRVIEHDPDHPEQWRVSFKIFSSPACGGSGERREPMGATQAPAIAPSGRCATTSPVNGGGKAYAPGFRSAWPLAERFEALLRVYNDPAPYARRLAQRLRKASALAQRIAAEAWGQCRDLIGHTLHDVLTEPIRNAARVFAEPAPNTS